MSIPCSNISIKELLEAGLAAVPEAESVFTAAPAAVCGTADPTAISDAMANASNLILFFMCSPLKKYLYIVPMIIL
ncbi:MAG: hypothetical protein DUD27_07560 [Lachnospiraceae bacterium]|nr:MAG: hypothetical protein DUD27_07560 [Lachnospiraceae bacterium]